MSAFGLGSESARAQEPEPEANAAEEPVEPEANAAEEPVEIVVTGDGGLRSSSEVLRDRTLLEAAPRRSGSELLAVVPGLFLVQHGGEGKAHQILYRGFDAVHGQDLEVWVAGAPVNDVSNVHGQGYTDLHFVIPEVVEIVRAKPGPFDPQQGDFAVAGTVRYELGYPHRGITFAQGLGDFGSRRTLLVARPGVDPGTFAAVELHHTDGFGPSRAADRASVMAQATASLRDGHQLRVMASHYAARFDSPGVVPLGELESGRRDRFSVVVPGQGGSSTRQQLVLELAADAGEHALLLGVYAVRRDLALRQNFTGYLEDPLGGDTTEQRNGAATVGLTLRDTAPLRLVSRRDVVAVGLDARSDRVEQRQATLEPSGAPRHTLVDADVRATRLGAYLDLALHPHPQILWRVGARSDAMAFLVDDAVPTTEGAAQVAAATRSAFGVHTGAKSTVDVTAARGLHLLLSYGDGFRSPQARSLGDGERAPFTTVHAGELGARWSPDARLTAALAGFVSSLSDDLVFDHATGRNQSFPGTLRTGLAAELVARAAWLTTSLNATLTRSEFRESGAGVTKGSLLPYAPQVVSRLESHAEHVLFTVAEHPLTGTAGGGMTLLAHRPLPFGEFGHEVLVADAELGARWRAVTLTTELYNVLDAHYYDGEFVYASSFEPGEPATLVPRRHVTVGAPRTAWVVLSLHL